MTFGSRSWTWAGRVLAAAALLFVATKLADGARLLATLTWSLGLLASAASVAAANLVAIGAHAVLWSNSLSLIGTPRSAIWAFRILGRTNLAKYVPGNVFHYVGRAAMARTEGLSLADCSRSIALETMIAAGVSALLAVPSVVLLARQLAGLTVGATSRFGLAALLLFVALLLVLATLAVLRPADRSSTPVRRQPTLFLVASASSLLGYLLVGITGFWFATELGAIPFEIRQAAGFVSASALAWLLGFLVPGAPGGLGIREAVLLLYLQGALVEPSTAALITLALRLFAIAAEILATGLAYALKTPDLRPTCQ